MVWHFDGTWQGYLAAVFRARAARDQDACLVAPETGLAWRNPRGLRSKTGTAGRDSGQADLDFRGLSGEDLTPDQPDKAGVPPGNTASGQTNSMPATSLNREGVTMPPSPGFFQDDRILALRVLTGLKRLAGQEACLHARDAWLHAAPGIEGPLKDFILLCTRLGPAALKAEAEPCVRTVLDRAQGVRRQAHKFMGILRFQELEEPGGLYAVMEPDHHILPLLAEHFLPRLGTQTWMIHDRLRNLGILHQNGTVEALEDLRLDQDLPVSRREKDFQALWQGFFKAVSIPGKENPALQRSHLPKKFWSCLTEIPGNVPGRIPGQAGTSLV